MRQTVIIFTLFFSIFCFGQIEVKIISLNKDTGVKKVSISITNLTNEYYVIPFDAKGFKGYNAEEFCNNLITLDYPHRFFAFSLIFQDKTKKEPESSLIRSYHLGHLQQSETNKINLEYQKKKNKIVSWKKKNNFKTDLEAERNFYIMNNLLFLAPKEKKVLNIEMNIFEIIRGDTMFYDYYNLENGKGYDFNVQLCVDKSIYSYLTEKQKKDMQKYIFFVGMLQSNILHYDPGTESF